MPDAGSSSRSPTDIFSRSQTVRLFGLQYADHGDTIYFGKPGSNPGECATYVPSILPELGLLYASIQRIASRVVAAQKPPRHAKMARRNRAFPFTSIANRS